MSAATPDSTWSARDTAATALRASREACHALDLLTDRVALLEEWYAITSLAGRVTNHDDNGETTLSFDHSTATELQRIDYALTPVAEKVPA